MIIINIIIFLVAIIVGHSLTDHSHPRTWLEISLICEKKLLFKCKCFRGEQAGVKVENAETENVNFTLM